MYSKEIIEKLLHGYILLHQVGTLLSQDFSNCTFGMLLHCIIFIFTKYYRWFTTLLAANHFGIFSYWKIDIMSGAGDNTNEDSDI